MDSARPELPSWGIPTQSLLCVELHVSLCVYCQLLSDFNKDWRVLTNFGKILHIKFNESHSQVVTCRQAGTVKLTGGFL